MPSADRPPSPYGVEATSREPIAVVGIGCRFPAGGPAGSATEGADAYWRFLMAGGDGIAPDPQGRGDLGALYDPQPGRPGKLYTRHLGALGEVDAFDADLFGIGRRDAAASDPQQRLLLEVAWEALENAAIAPAAIAGRDVGTFVGAFSDDYAQSRLYDRDVDAIDGHTSLSVLRGLLAGRIAYHFDLHGPAMTVDTACSSALLAIHLACRALWAGECEAASWSAQPTRGRQKLPTDRSRRRTCAPPCSTDLASITPRSCTRHSDDLYRWSTTGTRSERFSADRIYLAERPWFSTIDSCSPASCSCLDSSPEGSSPGSNRLPRERSHHRPPARRRPYRSWFAAPRRHGRTSRSSRRVRKNWLVTS